MERTVQEMEPKRGSTTEAEHAEWNDLHISERYKYPFLFVAQAKCLKCLPLACSRDAGCWLLFPVSILSCVVCQ